MKYTRVLKLGCKGEDVKYTQKNLISLGYSCGDAGVDGSFGKDTEAAVIRYQREHKDIFGKQLDDDGKVGEKTWYAIERDCDAKKNTPKYTRVLKLGMSGDDVRYMKDCLFELKYYSPLIKKITNNTFGNDTYKAVRTYQTCNRDTSNKALEVDGKIGEKTWGAIERDYKNGKIAPVTPVEPVKPVEPEQPDSTISLDKYTHITADKRAKIEADLSKVSEIRQKIVLEILDYAYDKDVPGDVRALYLFGANLYDTNLKLNYADEAEIDRLAARNPNYFNGGRKEWMKQQVKKNPKLPASDCSGQEVGYLRKYEFVDNKFDRTANGLCGNGESTAISKSELKPGDWVGKDGHIGTYVGGGYVVEFYGGAYGCQLTKLDKRQGYDFIKKKVVNGSKWTKYRRPRYY